MHTEFWWEDLLQYKNEEEVGGQCKLDLRTIGYEDVNQTELYQD